jgi:NitT/TauT family transport system ATP-binding protein
MTPRPGRIGSELSIATPHPRAEAFRTSAEYAGYCRRTSALLGAAMAA